MILNIFSILASGQNVLKAFCQLYLLNNSWIHPFPLFHLNFYSISASWIFHTLPNCSLCLRFFQLKSIFCTAALISFQKKKLPTMLHLWIFSFLCFLFWIFVLHFGINFKSELLNMEYNALSSRSFLPLTSSLSLSHYTWSIFCQLNMIFQSLCCFKTIQLSGGKQVIDFICHIITASAWNIFLFVHLFVLWLLLMLHIPRVC